MSADSAPPFSSIYDLVHLHDRQFVEAAYIAILGRSADEEGARSFLAALRGGKSRLDILAELYFSDERRQLKEDDHYVHEFIKRMRRNMYPWWRRIFENCFGWRSAPQRGDQQISSKFVELMTHADDVFLAAAYRAILEREPGASEVISHLHRLRCGRGRWHVIRELCRSAEGKRAVVRLPDLDRAVRDHRRRSPQLSGTACDSAPCPLRNPTDYRMESRYTEERVRYPPRLPVTTRLDSPVVSLVVSPAAPTGVAPRLAASQLATAAASGVSPAERSIRDVRCVSDDAETSTSKLLACHDVHPLVGPADDGPVRLPGLSGISFATSAARKAYVEQGGHLPSGVAGVGLDDWDALTPTPMSPLWARTFRFLHISAGTLSSGTDVLIESFVRTFDRSNEVSLLIYTAGCSADEVRHHIRACRSRTASPPDIHVLDRELTDSELKSVYLACDVFVAPCRETDFGLPIARALVCEKPVIVTGYGGHMDYVDDKTGWMVAFEFEYPKGPDSLIGSMWTTPIRLSLEKCLWHAFTRPTSERLVQGRIGRHRLLDSYTWNTVARKLNDFASSLPRLPVASQPARIGWLTTWNVRCGIATYSAHLIEGMPPETVTVFAVRPPELVSDDGPNVLRSWRLGKDPQSNKLHIVLEEAQHRGLDALVIQFNYGFFNHADLAAFIKAAVDLGIVVLVDLHATQNHLEGTSNWSIAELVPALRRCGRILAHGPGDMNRLKAWGLLDNVMLFPHGVLTPETRAKQKSPDGIPLLASFGFALPNKGLSELLHAVKLLSEQGRPARLLMLNAEFPDPLSGAYVAQLRGEITQLGLDHLVTFCSDFLDDAQCHDLLTPADLIVNPYQRSGESASGSVRYGLAINRPVAVTPLAIFDDLGNAVFRLPGTSPEDIARGLIETLDALAAESPLAKQVSENALRWRDAHAYCRQSQRLTRLVESLRSF